MTGKMITLFLLFTLSAIPLLGDERLNTLRFGIDSEVISLIDTLAEEKDDTYQEELLTIYSTTINEKLKKRIVIFFNDQDLELGIEPFFEELEEQWDQEMDESLLLSIVEYLSSRQRDEITRFFAEELLSSRDNDIFIAAVNALGESGNSTFTDQLQEELDSSDISVNTRSALISALGKLGDEDSIQTLKDLLSDSGEEKSVRWRAATALGEIGGDESLNALISVLDDPDPLLRSKAIEALGNFTGKEAEAALIQALRDSFWRVRVSAAKSLGSSRSTEGVDILIYKAEHDPDSRNVRIAAIEALGEIGNSASIEFLKQHYLNKKSPLSTRSRAISVLLETAPGEATNAIQSVFKEEDLSSTTPIVKETARILSLRKSRNLSELYRSMLESGEKDLILDALRGIRINTMKEMAGDIEKLLESEPERIVQSTAEKVLESLKEKENDAGD